MSSLAAHGLSIRLPPTWEGSIAVLDLPPPAVNMPVLHATDQPLVMSRSTFAAELAARAGGTGTVVALVEFEPGLSGTELFRKRGLSLPIHEGDLHPDALQIPRPFQAGRQWFFTLSSRAFCLYVVLGTRPGLASRVRVLNEVLRSLEVQQVGSAA